MTLGRALELFYTAILAEGKALTTVQWYEKWLSKLHRFLGDIELETITIDHLRRFLAGLRGNDRLYQDHPTRNELEGTLSAASLNGIVRAIKRFYNWLEKERHITPEQNAARRLDTPKTHRPPPLEASVDDIRALLEAARHSTQPERDYAMLLFLWDTGCRRSELVNLRVCDIDLAGERALLTGKGQQSRYVLFGDATKAALEAWLAKRPDGTDRVFVGQRGALTANAVNLMINRLKTQAGVTGPVYPQSLRHAFAKLYLNNGGDLTSLARLLGHTDVAVTRDLYSVFQAGELKRQHQHHSPVDTILETERGT